MIMKAERKNSLKEKIMSAALENSNMSASVESELILGAQEVKEGVRTEQDKKENTKNQKTKEQKTKKLITKEKKTEQQRTEEAYPQEIETAENREHKAQDISEAFPPKEIRDSSHKNLSKNEICEQEDLKPLRQRTKKEPKERKEEEGKIIKNEQSAVYAEQEIVDVEQRVLRGGQKAEDKQKIKDKQKAVKVEDKAVKDAQKVIKNKQKIMRDKQTGTVHRKKTDKLLKILSFLFVFVFLISGAIVAYQFASRLKVSEQQVYAEDKSNNIVLRDTFGQAAVESGDLNTTTGDEQQRLNELAESSRVYCIISSSPYFKDNKSKGSLFISNPKECEFYTQVVIKTEDEKEMYVSPLLAPDEKIEYDYLTNKEFEKGTYDSNAYFNYFKKTGDTDTEFDYTYLGSMCAEINVVID